MHNRTGLATTVVALLALATSATAGDLDLTFGSDGKVITDLGSGTDAANAVAIQQDGKIVAVGRAGFPDAFAAVRYNLDGTLDPTFGIGGVATIDVGLFDEAFAVAIQSDGKIVAAGATAPSGFCCQFALARYNSDGSPDTSFGVGGVVTTSFGGLTEAFAVAIQADGKIVAAGSTFSPFISSFALARYNVDGSLDPGFGAGGLVTTDFGGVDAAGAVAIRADGRIVAVGGGGPSSDFALALYLSDGSLDSTFGTGGKVTTDFGSFDRANAVAIQTDGKIVVAGTGVERFALARYGSTGELDPSFDADGKVTTQFTGANIESANALVIQTDGKIVAAGSAFDGPQSLAIARFETNGSPDISFGDLGRVMTGFAGGDAEARGIALQADGLIVAAGGGGPCTPHCEYVLARYLRLPTADLSCTKTDGVVQKIAGEPVTYTIVVSNSEPNAVVGATVTDGVPGAIFGATWTCAITGGGTCGPGGSGSISDTLTLLIGATATYTLTGTIDIQATGTLSNTAGVVPPSGVTDLDPANDSATDIDTLLPAADLGITKTDGLERVEPGTPITYTIVGSNAGPHPVSGATVADTIPAGITGATWTCVAAGGGSCTAAGSGSIHDTVNLPAGSSVTYALTGTVSLAATNPLINTATIAVPPGLGVGDPYPSNDSATDYDVLAGADYFTLAPCRVVDTRGPGTAPIGGPALQGQQTRVLAMAGHCGIPPTATALSVNLTVTQPATVGNIRLFPAGVAQPLIASINYAAAQTRANNAIVELNPGGELAVFVAQPAGTTVHLIVDVTGYFE